MNTDGGRKMEREGHGRGLGDDRKGSDLLFGELPGGTIGADMVGTYENSIADAEGRWPHAFEVGGLSHGVLGVLHAVAEEAVNFVEVDGEMSGSQVGDFRVRMNGDNRVVAFCREEGRHAGSRVRGVIVSKLG